jgi:ArsR family transcriptional regulator, lead/cadmium/zinc/bismuth-responsive transcriptional repressor
MNICSDIHMYQTSKKPRPPENSDSARAAPVVEQPCEAVHLGVSEARRALLIASHTVEALAETFRVLGDPTRVRILDALSGGELCVCDIASLVGISESAVSHQLRLLRGMRLVRHRRDGRQVFYAVDDHHIIELLKQALTHVEE